MCTLLEVLEVFGGPSAQQFHLLTFALERHRHTLKEAHLRVLTVVLPEADIRNQLNVISRGMAK